jgi:membrane protein DedA with SNARE-associated domain
MIGHPEPNARVDIVDTGSQTDNIPLMVEWLSNLVISMIAASGYGGIFLTMAVESACVPFPSEVIMPFAGLLVSQGKMSLWAITMAGALGNLAGSIVAYLVGAFGGRPFLEHYGKYLLISHKKLEIADGWFAKYGGKAVFFSRMMPIVRTFISLPAGIARMNFLKFLIYTFVGAVPWCLLLGYIGVLLGPEWERIKPYFHILDIVVVIAFVGAVIYFVMKRRKKLAT